MFAAVSLVIFTLLALVMGDMTATNIKVMNEYRKRSADYKIMNLKSAYEEYYQVFGKYPSSVTQPFDLSVLYAPQGFEQYRSDVTVGGRYAIMAFSTQLTDTLWSFDRALLVGLDPYSGYTGSVVSSTNTCGTGNFASSASWCGPQVLPWFKFETKEKFNSLISIQRARQQRMMQKFATYFNDKQYFPKKDQANADLVAGTSYDLRTLANYTGLANNCSGTFTWQGIPLDCSDMFDQWGSPISYMYFSVTHVSLSTVVPIKNNLGVNVTVATDLDAT